MYTVHQSNRARKLRFTYSTAHGVRLVVPKRASQRQIDAFVNHSMPRVEHHHAKHLERKKRNPDIATQDLNHYQKYKAEAVQCAQYLVEERSKKIPYEYNTIRVKRMSSKRGSCSSKRNLNFNYKMLFLEPWLQDYLVVHEMCHLKEMNHSSRFRSLVEDYYWPCKEARLALRRL